MPEWAMTLLTILGAIAGSGAGAALVNRWMERGTKRLELEATTEEKAKDREHTGQQKLVTELRSMLQDERSLVQAERSAFMDERKGHLDCLERVSKVEAEMSELRRQHGECSVKTASLEAQVAQLRDQVLQVYTRSTPPPPAE